VGVFEANFNLISSFGMISKAIYVNLCCVIGKSLHVCFNKFDCDLSLVLKYSNVATVQEKIYQQKQST